MSKSKKAEVERQAAPSQEDVVKALDALEAFVAKGGDPLTSSDPDGHVPDLPKQGKALQKQMAGAGRVSKMMSSSDESDVSDDSDDSSSDDDSGESADYSKKSFRERAEGDRTMKKGMNVSDFLDRFVSTQSDHLDDLRKGIETMLDDARTERRSFDKMVAKAFSQLGGLILEQNNVIKEQGDLIKALTERLDDVEGGIGKVLDEPVRPGTRAPVLAKGEVRDRRFGPQNSNAHPLDDIESKAITDWLFQKAQTGELGIDEDTVIMFEARRYDPRYLSAPIQKALEADFCA